jgi:hypothetical protein
MEGFGSSYDGDVLCLPMQSLDVNYLLKAFLENALFTPFIFLYLFVKLL